MRCKYVMYVCDYALVLSQGHCNHVNYVNMWYILRGNVKLLATNQGQDPANESVNSDEATSLDLPK